MTPTTPSPSPSPSPNILIAVPSASFGSALRNALLTRGINVYQCGTARQALACIEENPVDAAVIDANIPQMGGFELAIAMRAHLHGKSLTLVLLTDVPWTVRQKQVAVSKINLLDLLLKPIDEGWLAERIVVELAFRRTEALDSPRGNLENNPFPILLARIGQRKANGALFLVKGRAKQVVFFRRGRAFQVRSNDASASLTQILVQEDLLSERDSRRVKQQLRKSKQPVVTLLLQAQLVTRQQIALGLTLQLREELLELFRWETGIFYYYPRADLPSAKFDPLFEQNDLIAEGIHAWSLSRLKRSLEPYLNRPLHLAPSATSRSLDLPLDEKERGLIDAAATAKTLRELLHDTPLPQQRAYAAIYLLIVLDILVPH